MCLYERGDATLVGCARLGRYIRLHRKVDEGNIIVSCSSHKYTHTNKHAQPNTHTLDPPHLIATSFAVHLVTGAGVVGQAVEDSGGPIQHLRRVVWVGGVCT